MDHNVWGIVPYRIANMGIWHISCLFPSFWFWLKSSIHNVILEQVLSAKCRKQSVRLISNFAFCQILPVSIKSLGGSFATLAAWLTSFAITMTANLMLTWSVGGSSFILCLSFLGIGLWTMISDAGCLVFFLQIQQALSSPTWLWAPSLWFSSSFGCQRQRAEL